MVVAEAKMLKMSTEIGSEHRRLLENQLERYRRIKTHFFLQIDPDLESTVPHKDSDPNYVYYYYAYCVLNYLIYESHLLDVNHAFENINDLNQIRLKSGETPRVDVFDLVIERLALYLHPESGAENLKKVFSTFNKPKI